MQAGAHESVPGCVRPRATENIAIDPGRSVRYAQKQENTSFFSNVTTIVPLSSPVGNDTATLSGSEQLSRDRSLAQTPPEQQDLKIIPV